MSLSTYISIYTIANYMASEGSNAGGEANDFMGSKKASQLLQPVGDRRVSNTIGDARRPCRKASWLLRPVGACLTAPVIN